MAENPLREMRLGAVLGTEAFIEWAREKVARLSQGRNTRQVPYFRAAGQI